MHCMTCDDGTKRIRHECEDGRQSHPLSSVACVSTDDTKWKRMCALWQLRAVECVSFSLMSIGSGTHMSRSLYSHRISWTLWGVRLLSNLFYRRRRLALSWSTFLLLLLLFLLLLLLHLRESSCSSPFCVSVFICSPSYHSVLSLA